MLDKTNGGFLISKIKQIQGRVFEKLRSEHGIDQFNGAQGRILFVLWEKDNIPISELSKQTFYKGFIDKEIAVFENSLTKILDNLTNKENEK